MARPGVMVYFDFLPGLECLDALQRCMVYDAIMAYGQYGVMPEFEDPTATAVWKMIRAKLDTDRSAYEKKVEKRRAAANARWDNDEPEMQMHSGEEPVQETKRDETKREETKREETKREETKREETRREETKREETKREETKRIDIFSPPTYQEVVSYCEKNNLKVNPHQFVDYYTANGWRIGQNPIADWRAALRSWEKNKKEPPYGSQAYTRNKFPGLDKIGTRL